MIANQIESFIETLKGQGLCHCCIARELMWAGRSLLEDTVGDEEAGEIVEQFYLGMLGEANNVKLIDVCVKQREQ